MQGAMTPIQNPINYDDFVKPNPFIMSWMLPHLPHNARVRDVIFVCLVGVVGLLVAIPLNMMGVNDYVAAFVALGPMAIVKADSLNRFIDAGRDYRRAKRIARDMDEQQ
jgi:hypothetical protein